MKQKPTNLFGSIQDKAYLDEVKTEGVKSTFREGLIYRYPGLSPMLEVQGDHYQMGLQYAVLLHEELGIYIDSIYRVLLWSAARAGTPVEAMYDHYKAQAVNIMNKLPQRFIREMEGIAEGSGLPLETVAILSLNYDVLMSACTGVLMRTENGGVVHARNNDTAGFGGEELGKISVVVKHKAKGYHTVTHIDFPFFMGVETGYNDQGLTFSEETLHVQQPAPDGFSLPYLVRIIMEECGSIDDLPQYFDRYPVIGAYGTVWSDRQAAKGMVVELTPTAWACIDLEDALLWNFNHLYSQELLPQQIARTNVNPDLDREAVAATFPIKEYYSVEDALDFIGLQIGPDGKDYSHCGTRNTICNKAATQSMVFDPDSLDFYLGVGVYYAARQNVYRIYDDFSIQPTLFREGAAMKPSVVETARIYNLLQDDEAQRDAFIDLATKYKDDPQVYFMVAFYSFQSNSLAEYGQYADEAYCLAPSVGEYQLFAGLAAYQRGEVERAIDLLKDLTMEGVERKQEPLRLYTLQKCWQGLDDEKSQHYQMELTNFLAPLGAVEYFQKTLIPLIDIS